MARNSNQLFFRTRDLERLFNKHRRTIIRWLVAGKLPTGNRVGNDYYWSKADLEKWLSSERCTARYAFALARVAKRGVS